MSGGVHWCSVVFTMSRLTSAGAGTGASAHVFVKTQLCRSMPASTFTLPVDLQRTRISDLAPVIAGVLARQAAAYPEARAQFSGDAAQLHFSKDGFAFNAHAEWGHTQALGGSSLPPSQHGSSLALLGYANTGGTLHVAHADDLAHALRVCP